MSEDIILSSEEQEQQNLLEELLEELAEKGLYKPEPKVKSGKKKGAVVMPKISFPDPLPMKILQEFCSFQCSSCGSTHRFLMKNLVGYKEGTGIAFREIKEMTDKLENLLYSGAVETEERHVQILECPTCILGVN